MSMNEGSRLVVLGVSSSISLYKAPDILRGFQKEGWEVQVILTPNAAKLISPLLFSALSGRRAALDPFNEEESRTIAHIRLAQEAGLFVVAPATANVLAKFAAGIADDFLCTFYTAADCPVLLAPAMNQAMYIKPQTQENIARLKARGVEFVEPDRGPLACGDEGWGRLAPPEKIVQAGLRLWRAGRSLAGRSVLITAGPTREPLDLARYLSNRSSGKMGYALAREAVRRGAETTLVSGPVSLGPPPQAKFVQVETAVQMEAEVLKRFDQADVVIMAAAVADFRFAQTRPDKVKKEDVPGEVRLVRNADILAELGRRKTHQVLVGFAAEAGQVEAKARQKLKDKNCDLMAANDISREGIGFDSEENELLLVDSSGKATPLGRASKSELSRLLFDRIEVLLGQNR
jgi:phosphopantothenoylcysteine decarboxylase/phosphopantothenate--cysteine ligase